jgi:hypothetical protein
VIESLVQLLGRQVEAAGVLEARLRALELIVAAGEQRFLMQALDEVETASEKLSSLELTRALVLSTAGYAPDVSADELVASRDVTDGADYALRARIEDLRTAMLDLAAARSRTDHEVRAAATVTRQRRGAAEAFAAV